MKPKKQPYPFEATFDEIQANPDAYVGVVFDSLQSDFLTLPRGRGFVDYPTFERGYEALKQATGAFSAIESHRVLAATTAVPVSLVVLRAMLGFTPPEWAYVASQRTGVQIEQGSARTLDRRVRLAPETPMKPKGVTADRLRALVETRQGRHSDGTRGNAASGSDGISLCHATVRAISWQTVRWAPGFRRADGG
jgi:hypothetical protein